MNSITPEKLICAFDKLSTYIAQPCQNLQNLINSAQNSNAWFTPEQVGMALNSLHTMLNHLDVKKWFDEIEVNPEPKKIGLILAGNIPLVGFHDVLCVLATGNMAMIKMSSSDDKLLPALLNELIKIEPFFADKIKYTDRLKDFDAIIATGSNNSSRYFEYYFGSVPHIIRKNRNSVAVLNGTESTTEITLLGNDIFNYFGLGCRNVSKIFIPKAYSIQHFFEPLEIYQPISNHFKYNNNYDYNKSIYLVNNQKHYDNGFLLLKEDKNLASPLAVLYFEEYEHLNEVEKTLAKEQDNIQCVVSKLSLNIETNTIPFGQTQQPKLFDYADNINTIEFLNHLILH